MAKRLELLKEIVPAITQAAVLLNPGNAANGPVRQAMGTTAKALQVGLQPFELRGELSPNLGDGKGQAAAA